MSEGTHLDSDGIWCQISAQPGPVRGEIGAARGRPALFMDRDGVVVEEAHFLHRPEDVRLVPGAASVIAEARAHEILAILITNQSGIARGLFGWEDFAATQRRLEALLAAEGAALDMTLACPFHPEGRAPYRQEHPCRKPQPGMLLRAAERLEIDLARSWVVGDRARDLEAGRGAGCAGGHHVLTGHGAGERNAARRLETEAFAVKLADSIAEIDVRRLAAV